ncbi:MAG: hypothetical protein RL338_1726 [Chloroflexota bacterium]
MTETTEVTAVAAHRRRSVAAVASLAVAVVLAVAGILAATSAARTAGAGGTVTVLAAAPSTLDPAAAGDAGTAAVVAQLYETLTAYDPDLVLRPALAESWEIGDGGLLVRFRLRDGLVFSDGSPLTGADVVRSWLRIIDPDQPSPLSSLALDIAGAGDYLAGRIDDPAGVGLSATGDVVEVRLARPTDLPAIVSSPIFAIVPEGFEVGFEDPDRFVGSGAYRVAELAADRLVLEANERYWAGPASIGRAVLVSDVGGRSPVEVFADGEVDYAPISSFDASWIAYDRDLGPSLVATPALALDYYGFDTTEPPFDDARVRRAISLAVDWRRIVELGSGGEARPADSMVPVGIPGRAPAGPGEGADIPRARELLAAAGFPDGRGFPTLSIVSGGDGYEGAIAAELEAALGIDVSIEVLDYDAYFARLAEDPPAMWGLSWIADYPSPDDFLGVLLGSDRSSNYTRWRNEAFDAAIADAVGARDPAAAAAAYARAERIVRDEAPAIPVSYSTGWTLVREGLRGARENGLGILRLAGLAWEAP